MGLCHAGSLLFGLPAEMGVAVSLLKRAREIVLGVPAYTCIGKHVEGRKAFASGEAGTFDIALVTGASGFVGRAAVREAARAGPVTRRSGERRELGRAAGGKRLMSDIALVTGASGFAGSAVACALVARSDVCGC